MTTIQIVIICSWAMAIASALGKQISSTAYLIAWSFAIAISIFGLVH